MSKLTVIILTMAVFVSHSVKADQIVRRAGEWHGVVSGFTPEPQIVELCFSAATAAQAAEQSVAKLTNGRQCSKKDVKVDGSQVTFQLACGDVSMRGNGTWIGDSESKAYVTLTVGTGSAAKVLHGEINSKWIGPCKPGETPQ